jgi:predicted nucleic acid-binding protein
LTFLDAYALIAFLVGGPAAAGVRALLREGDAAVATANLAEALDVSQRIHGVPIARALGVLDPLLDEAIEAVPLDVIVACRAAELRSRYYHRASRPVSLADTILLASARPGDRVATADPHVLAIAAAEKLGAVALPPQA